MWRKITNLIAGTKKGEKNIPKNGYKVAVTPLTNDGVMGIPFSILSWDKAELEDIRETLKSGSGPEKYGEFFWAKFSTTLLVSEQTLRMDWLLRLKGYLVSPIVPTPAEYVPAPVCSGALFLPRLLKIGKLDSENFATSIYIGYSGEEDGWTPAVFLAAGLANVTVFRRYEQIPDFMKRISSILRQERVLDAITKKAPGKKVLRLEEASAPYQAHMNDIEAVLNDTTKIVEPIEFGVGTDSFLLVTISGAKNS